MIGCDVLTRRGPHRTRSPLWCLLCAALASAACTFDALPPLDEYPVGGSLRGLWNGSQVDLTLKTSDGGEEHLTLSADGEFAFARGLPSGAGYVVELADDVEHHTCEIVDGSGTVTSTEVDSILVRCTGPVPVAITLTNPFDGTIETSLPSQLIPVSLLQQEARVIVTAPGATGIDINGVPLTSGFPSGAHRLDIGKNTIAIQVRVNELSRDFQLLVDRGNLTGPQEYGFLKASNLESGDRFGSAIAAMDNQVWIGAPLEDSATTSGADNDAPDSGAVYAFKRNGATWEQTGFFKRTFNPGAKFGAAIAVSPSIVFVGAPAENRESPGVGSIYPFYPNASSWLGGSRMGPADPATVSNYGWALALDDDTLAVTSRLPGSVHILRAPDWMEERVIRPAHVEVSDSFGQSIALRGDLLVVGARNDSSTGAGVLGTTIPTDNDSLYSGAVYVFRSDGGAWNLESFIKASNAEPYDKFGAQVAFDGETLVVSATEEASGTQSQADNSVPSAGAVYVFRRENGTWRQEAYIKSPQPSANHGFGNALAVQGDLIAVGEFTDSGTVHLFQRQASGWTWVAAMRSSNGEMSDAFGTEAIALTNTGFFGASKLEDSDGSGPQNDASPDSGAAYTFR